MSEGFLLFSVWWTVFSTTLLILLNVSKASSYSYYSVLCRVNSEYQKGPYKGWWEIIIPSDNPTLSSETCNAYDISTIQHTFVIILPSWEINDEYSTHWTLITKGIFFNLLGFIQPQIQPKTQLLWDIFPIYVQLPVRFLSFLFLVGSWYFVKINKLSCRQKLNDNLIRSTLLKKKYPKRTRYSYAFIFLKFLGIPFEVYENYNPNYHQRKFEIEIEREKETQQIYFYFQEIHSNIMNFGHPSKCDLETLFIDYF